MIVPIISVMLTWRYGKLFDSGTWIDRYFFILVGPGKNALDIAEFFIGTALGFFRTFVSVFSNKANGPLFERVELAEKWLRENAYKNRVLKWETKRWGENPADFGRKG